MPSKKTKKPKKLHQRIKRHHIHASLIVAILASVAGFFIHTTSHANPCVAQFNITSPQNGSTIAGPVTLQALRTGTTVTGSLRFQLISPLQMMIGQTTSTDGNSWSMPWPSTSQPDGSYQMVVVDDQTCMSNPVSFNIRNSSVQPQLITQLAPVNWSGNTNVASNLAAYAQFRDPNGVLVNVTDGAQYHWTTTIGTVSPNGRTATFYSGPTAGSGIVTVSATYNGLTTQAQSQIKVFAYQAPPVAPTTPSATPPAPTTTTSSSSTSSSATTTSSSSTADTSATQPISVPLEPAIATCLQTALSQKTYQAIIEGKLAATPEQRLQAVKCFAPQFVIPARLAPVSPNDIAGLQSGDTKNLTVAKAATETNDNKKSIKLSGKAAPNTDVYIYIFSEPLVLKAKSDSQGNWSYSLENPLKPGSHKVYAVTQGASGTFVRSESFPITVAQAAPSGENPAGNSLQLTSQNNTVLYIYLAVAALILAFGIRLVFILRRNRRALGVA